MKNKFMKKAVAAALSVAIVLSMLPLSDLTDVSAKAPFVKLNTTFKTLVVGQTYKLKIKNNTLGWKVTKAVAKDSTICKAANKKSYVKLSAKGEGRTSIRVTLKTAKRKGAGATKKLSCRVNVKPVEALPDTPEVPDMPALPDTPTVATDKTVESQEALEKALADENIKKITIKTDSEKTFKIASGEYKDVDVIVDAPKADVDNSGVFKSITIKAIKDSTWFEKAIGNAIRVEALKTRIVVEQSAVVSDISLVTPGADVGIEARGAVKDIHIKSRLTAVISGSATAKIPVTVDAAAVGAALTFSIPVKVITAANVSVVFQKGAENSSLEMTEKTISVTVDTSVKIEVEKADGTKQTISANRKTTVTYTQPAPSSSGGNGGYYGGTGSSGTGGAGSTNAGGQEKLLEELDKAVSNLQVTLSGTVVVTGAPFSVEQGGYVLVHEENGELWTTSTVTRGALKLTISPIKVPSGLTVEKDEEHYDCESEIVWDMFVEGDRLPGHKIIPWEVKVISPVKKEIKKYFDVTLQKEKWISKDGVLVSSDFKVEEIDQKKVDELMKPKA